MKSLPDRIGSGIDRTIELSKGHRKSLLAVAAAAVAATVAYIVADNPEIREGFRPACIFLLLAVGVPLTIAQNAWRFRLTAQLLDIRSTWLNAFYVAAVTTAANLLPLPGGVLVRVASLRAASASYSDAGRATLEVALVWVSATLMVAGAGLLGMSFFLPGSALALSGILAALYIWKRLASFDVRFFVREKLFANHLLAAGVYAFRMMLCLAALGVEADLLQLTVLPVAPLVGAAVVFMPGGLGVREVTAALLGMYVGLPAEFVFLAETLNRVVGLLGNGALTLMLYYLTGRKDFRDIE